MKTMKEYTYCYTFRIRAHT